jgi:phospholipid transport system transporter-binding protein
MKAAIPYALEAAGPGRFALSGQMLFSNAAALLKRGEDAFAGHAAVTLDLAGVTHIDSGGLAVLLEWLRGARRSGRKLRFESLPAQLLAMARICGTEALLREQSTTPA